MIVCKSTKPFNQFTAPPAYTDNNPGDLNPLFD